MCFKNAVEFDEGFLKAAGLSSLDEATIQKDPKKGDFYVAVIDRPGKPAIEEVRVEIVPDDAVRKTRMLQGDAEKLPSPSASTLTSPSSIPSSILHGRS